MLLIIGLCISSFCWLGLGLISAIMLDACYGTNKAPLWMKVGSVLSGPVVLIGLGIMFKG